jgi:cellulose synthase/poly-beta-1,6-N-acetylglucosamine synthase-like glycosyltransferase
MSGSDATVLGARAGRSRGQRIISLVLLAAVVAWVVASGRAFPLQAGIALMGFSALVVAAKVAAVLAGLLRRHAIVIEPTAIAAAPEADWPGYTVLVPLYREADVVPELVAALGRLDYPRDRLQVLLLLEEDDAGCRAAVAAQTLPPWIEALVVPPGTPRTKPRACNVGLERARGELTVIFDAEDRPEPDQLKKAALAFAQAGGRVACLQAKLNCFNRGHSLVTRCFTLEYSAWFDLYLPGLHAIGAPIPLGGTSNHFRTVRLRELGGWDAWNVTEDCDLGLRLARARLDTRILDSTTWEEAPVRAAVWLKQRSRWMKGYWQTHIAHTRQPLRTLAELGAWRTALMLLTVGGQVLSLLLLPLSLAALVLSGLDGWQLFDPHRPATVALIVIAVALALANLLFVLIHALAALRRGFHDLLPTALLLPLYWLGVSLGTWRGFLQSFSDPFHWEKTPHGASALVATAVAPVRAAAVAPSPAVPAPRRTSGRRRLVEALAIVAVLAGIVWTALRMPQWMGTDQQIRYAAISMEVPVLDQQRFLDQPWTERSEVVYTVSLPGAADPPVLRAVAFLKVWDGEWYQLESRDIRPCPRGLDIAFPLDAAWQAQGSGRPWSRDCLRRVRAAGLRLYGAEVAERGLQIVDVRASGEAAVPLLAITAGALPPAEQRAMIELPFTLSRSYANPFDTRRISVEGVFTAPDGTVVRVPAFYTQDYVREDDQSRETLRASGAPHWAVRWTPEVPGVHRFAIEAREGAAAPVASPSRDITVAASDRRGFVRVDEDRRHFRFDDGSFLYPLAWNIRSPRDDILPRIAEVPQPDDALGAIAMEGFVDKLADAKQNIGRVWMSPWFGSLEWDKEAAGYHGLGQYNLQNAWRLDRVLAAAARRGILIELALHHHGPFTERYDSQWQQNPYNARNGGPLAHPAEVMVDDEAKRLFADRLRYIAARWGADPALFAWTMWIEVDTVAKGPPTTVWHVDMAHRLRGWDQGRHILSTEFCNSPGIDALWRVPEIEYVQMGGYSFGGGLLNVLNEYARDLQYGKPLIIEEYGGHAQGGSAAWIAHELHDGPWMGWMLPLSGAPMPWWWNLAFHYRLEDRHRRFADFIAGEDLRRVAWRHTTLPVVDAAKLAALARLSPERGFIWVYAPEVSNFNIKEKQYWGKMKAGERVYAQNAGTFSALAKDPGDLFAPVVGATLRLDGLQTGEWRAEFWDTWSDAVADSIAFTVAVDGTATLPLPRLVRDCAVKLVRK